MAQPPKLATLPKLPKRRQSADQRCRLCGCRVHRSGKYGLPTVEGRSHASLHHYVAERFFGRSVNRRGEQRARVFETCPWGLEGKTAVYCYECGEELLHNPVLTEADVERFARLVATRGLSDDEKGDSRERHAGRVRLLRDVIDAGLGALLDNGAGGIPKKNA